MAGAGAGVGVGDDGKNREKNIQKSYFDVLGLCCSSEVPLIEKILNSLDGIHSVSVVVPTKTVIVVHDNALITQLQIVNALNQARLEATIRAYGKGSSHKLWPSPFTLASGVLLLLSFLKYVWHPMHWLALGAVMVGILPILLRAFAAIRRCMVDVNILMLIAVAGSIALSDYWEAGTIVFLFTIAEWLQSRATYKATAVMSSLMNMAPQKAILADSGFVVDARDVKINTILAVKAGEVIPIDGLVVEGNCEVDESSLTGESFPVAKQAHSLVWAGTHNINGYISVRTTALAEDSAVAKMTRLVEEAQNSKSRIHRMIDSCAKYYTPAVVLASALLAVIPIAMKVDNPRHWLHLALVLLVSACPCALVLSTPVATFCALTKAASIGLLVKGGDFLETLAKTKIVAFDKTGTLTRGEFTVMDFLSLRGDINIDTLLYWVSSVECKSSHPMASALVDYARSNSVEPKPDDVSEFQIIPGEGVYGEVNGKAIHIGNRRIASRAGNEPVQNLDGKMKGTTIGYIFLGAEFVGIFSLADTCRTGAAEAMKDLKQLGAKVAMLTGDSRAAASHVQNQLGNVFDTVHAELLPEDKVRIINELKSEEGSVVMVGDGMNDAPALIAADVGISMGISGSAVAMETSHITLMSNDIRKIPEAIRLARNTKWKIIENIAISISTKAAIVALAFAGHPLLWAAVLADVGTCLLVILNSMLLLRKVESKGKKKCCSSSHGSRWNGLSSGHGEEHHGRGHCQKEDGCCQPKSSTGSCCQRNEAGTGGCKPHRHGPGVSLGVEHNEKGHCQMKDQCCQPKADGRRSPCSSKRTHCHGTAEKHDDKSHCHREDRCCQPKDAGKSCCTPNAGHFQPNEAKTESHGEAQNGSDHCHKEDLDPCCQPKPTSKSCCAGETVHREPKEAKAEGCCSTGNGHHNSTAGCLAHESSDGEHLIPTAGGVEHHKSEMSCGDGGLEHVHGDHGGDGCDAVTCTSAHVHGGWLYRREVGGGCCRRHIAVCRKKSDCCGSATLPMLSEIVTE